MFDSAQEVLTVNGKVDASYKNKTSDPVASPPLTPPKGRGKPSPYLASALTDPLPSRSLCLEACVQVALMASQPQSVEE